MTDVTPCRACGRDSSDPEWCDHCGAELATHADTAVRRPKVDDHGVLRLSRRPDDTRTDPIDLSVDLEEREIAVDADADDIPGAVQATDALGDRWRLVPPADAPLEGLVAGPPDRVDAPHGVVSLAGGLWRATPLREGVTLADRVMNLDRALTIDELADWLGAILDLLEACHAEGLACLRVAPFTVRFDDAGVARFDGLGGLFRIGDPLDALPAIEGYTAPEILHGVVPEGPQASADIYSVAMLAWCLVARRDPPVSALSGYLPVLDARDADPDGPLGLARFIAFAGAPEPGDRPASIAATRALLDECIGQARRWSGDAPMPQIACSVAADTHIGILKRYMAAVNQDAVFAATNDDGSRATLIVCDGVSTASWGSGDIASAVARAHFVEAWTRWRDDELPEDPSDWVRACIEGANAAVVKRVDDDFAPFEGEPDDAMGTTCVVAWIANGIAWIGSAGDSRAYIVRPRFVEQITRDHNLATIGLIQGVEPDDILTFAHGSALGRCLGLFDVGDDGHLTPREVEPDVVQLRLDRGDRLVLCTDGLTDFAGRDAAGAEMAIYSSVIGEPLPDLACLQLISEANRCGGGDNIGVAILAAEAEVIDPFATMASRFDLDDDGDTEPLDAD